MERLPRITVVTPVLNCVAHIEEALESVLRQEYSDLEYIVVDGGSTDGTLDVIRSYERRSEFKHRISVVISEPDNGMYDALCKGFDCASGEIYCYLNADDLFECGGLQSVGEFFAENPAAQVIYHEDVVLIDGWKLPNARQPECIQTADLLDRHILFQDGVFWRRSAYEAVGGFRGELRLAGDFDFWLRLSSRYRFVRRPGHVSCFRVRGGQLSAHMDRYFLEVEQAIADFLNKTSILERATWRFSRLLWRRRQSLRGNSRRNRLFFPMSLGVALPPAAFIPPRVAGIARSPIDGKAAERLLFTTPDTRFGERELNYVYFDSRHGIAITHPLIADEKLDSLYRRHYSSPGTEATPACGSSPFRLFNGFRVWEKLLFMLPVGFLARRLLPFAWSDNTYRELREVLQASGCDVRGQVRFLDAGCFEGQLLDQIRTNTHWLGFGLEPNRVAATIASRKGHLVWCARAEDAGLHVPQGQRFDVIYMGQSIEHVNDPIRVLRQLRDLLAPNGLLVVSTPNLNSKEIDWFGPTWAHWHAPYHRHIFSEKGLHALARRVGLTKLGFRSFSNPNWTALSLLHNRLGLAGSASHAVPIDPDLAKLAHRINFWKSILWNRIGKGDYYFFVMKKHLGGTSDHDR